MIQTRLLNLGDWRPAILHEQDAFNQRPPLQDSLDVSPDNTIHVNTSAIRGVSPISNMLPESGCISVITDDFGVCLGVVLERDDSHLSDRNPQRLPCGEIPIYATVSPSYLNNGKHHYVPEFTGGGMIVIAKDVPGVAPTDRELTTTVRRSLQTSTDQSRISFVTKPDDAIYWTTHRNRITSRIHGGSKDEHSEGCLIPVIIEFIDDTTKEAYVSSTKKGREFLASAVRHANTERILLSAVHTCGLFNDNFLSASRAHKAFSDPLEADINCQNWRDVSKKNIAVMHEIFRFKQAFVNALRLEDGKVHDTLLVRRTPSTFNNDVYTNEFLQEFSNVFKWTGVLWDNQYSAILADAALIMHAVIREGHVDSLTSLCECVDPSSDMLSFAQAFTDFSRILTSPMLLPFDFTNRCEFLRRSLLSPLPSYTGSVELTVRSYPDVFLRVLLAELLLRTTVATGKDGNATDLADNFLKQLKSPVTKRMFSPYVIITMEDADVWKLLDSVLFKPLSLS